jgi:glycosyltransferase involved in cell wall biosynthesis
VVGTGFLTNQLVRYAANSDEAVLNVVGVLPDAPLAEGASKLSVWLRKLWRKTTARRVDRYIAVSHNVRKALVGEGVPAERIAVVLNGVDTERLRHEATLGSEGIPTERPLVAAVGRLAPVKGMEELIRAAALVPEAAFAILGQGPLDSCLRKLASSVGVADRVRFLGQKVNVAALMATADVVAVPSLSEGFGLVAAEAATLGRPVVATRVGGLAEIVEDGFTGRLVPPGNPKELAAALRQLLDNPIQARGMGERARERSGRFSSDRMAAEYIDIFEALSASSVA